MTKKDKLTYSAFRAKDRG